MKLFLSNNRIEYSYLQMYKENDMYTDIVKMAKEINIELNEFKKLFETFNPHYISDYWCASVCFEEKDIENVQFFLDSFNILLKLSI